MDYEDMDVSFDRDELFRAVRDEYDYLEDWDALLEMMKVEDVENGVIGGLGDGTMCAEDDYWEDWDALREMMELDDA
ncbi:hypothetical protein RvY_12339 [Ramazzottius varieornatus]|uniref:Uncharacterized protein n=1 Tax=Ramazzottius varieornatus TaxID=947166 RepID=A0A1D1VL61_RAMVA|nr:hypothetical protein RvY_12339 [Ramazzottius varieornatus]